MIILYAGAVDGGDHIVTATAISLRQTWMYGHLRL
jgi:hypothetical protein